MEISLLCPLYPGSPAHNEEHDAEDQSDDKEYPGDVDGGSGDAGEAQNSGYKRDDYKCCGPTYHGNPPFGVRPLQPDRGILRTSFVFLYCGVIFQL